MTVRASSVGSAANLHPAVTGPDRNVPEAGPALRHLLRPFRFTWNLSPRLPDEWKQSVSPAQGSHQVS
jgi:hypothetical protein